jgi:hypothetical protein
MCTIDGHESARPCMLSSIEIGPVTRQVAEHLAAAIMAIRELYPSVAVTANQVAEVAPALVAAPIARARSMASALQSGASKQRRPWLPG